MLPRMWPPTAAPTCGGAASRSPGHRGDADLARRGLGDPDPGVQAAALGALARLGALTADDVAAALATGSPALRRRAVEAAPAVRGPGSRSSLPAAVDRRARMTPTRSWSSARRGSWPSADAGRPCRRWWRRRPGTATPAVARPPSPRSAPSAIRRGSRPCSPRWRQAHGQAAGHRRAGRLRRPPGRTGTPVGGRRPGLAGAPGRRRAARRGPGLSFGSLPPNRPR